MAAAQSGHDGSIDNKQDAVEQIVDGGVVADGVLAEARGEGRQRRYFLGGENVAKGDVVEAVLGADEVEDAGADEEPEHGSIECRYCGAAVGYLTGSHMKSHDEGGPQSVDAYRALVAEQEGVEPSEVPIAPDELGSLFEEAGQHDEETRERLAEMNKERWEAGEYDHLRQEDDEE